MSGNTIPSAATSRACDRCRRRKAKCDQINSTCSRCKAAGLKCTFDLPVQRRGPKTRYPAKNAAASSALTTTATTNTAIAVSAGTTTTFAVRKPSASQGRDSVATSSIPLPDSTWEMGISADSDISSPRLVDLQNTLLDETLPQQPVASQRWHDLEAQIKKSVSNYTLEGIVLRCFDLYSEYLFPTIPLINGACLRDILNFFLATTVSPLRHDGENLEGRPMAINNLGSSTLYRDLGLFPESAFTLITSFCAQIAISLPGEVFPEGCVVSNAFLTASRDCLDSYVEADLDNPNATSVIIRYLHYSCFREAGKSNYARRIFGETTCLAQEMQMNDDLSLQSLHPAEAELRRRAFWMIFIEDKASAILRRHPTTVHPLSFETGITTSRPTGDIADIVMDMQPIMSNSQSDSIVGLNARIILWQAASDILLEIRMLQEHARITQSASPPLSTEGSSTLDMLYVRFITCLDGFPHYLRMEELENGDINHGQSNRFATIQKVHLNITFQFLRMVLLQRISSSETGPQSKSEQRMLALRKTEVARDLLKVLRGSPFWALQMDRLPCAEKIHFVSAGLLMVLREGENETSSLISQARNDFALLVDILTRLDYRLAETLQ